jgi:predicted molibdopterin-dependent oxidoreductase YjgC
VPDYLSQRQNVLTQDSTEKAEFNTYLETVAAKFGLRWLEQTSGNPVQELWQAKHTLAPNEMLTLGYAVKNLAQAGPTWTRHQIAQMKTGSIGEQAGAAFELLGLNCFRGPVSGSCRHRRTGPASTNEKQFPVGRSRTKSKFDWTTISTSAN